MKSLLTELGLKEDNLGTCTGIDNWLESDAEVIESLNPTTGEVIARVQEASPEAYEQVIGKAQTSFTSWRSLPAPKRGDLIRDFGNALREKKEALGDLVSLEMGKIRSEGHGEVQEMIDICDFAVGLSRQLYGLTMQSERPQHRMYEQWHPLGVIGIITAFNFPVAPWAWNAAIAAVCGDTMIWKPSELTPLCAVATQHIANQVMADHGVSAVFNLAVGKGDIGKALSDDRRVPLISFTGSIPTGRKVSQSVAARLAKSILELGGNNAIIVSAKANLDLAVRAIVFGAVGTAGQRCTSTRRIIAHSSIMKDLESRLVNAYKQIPAGDPLKAGTLLGPLIHQTAVDKMMAAIEAAKAQGGEVLTGGNTLANIGPTFVEPTIIRMPQQQAIVCDETFAPILYLMTYDSLEQAIAMHNDVPQGLSSAMFTDSLSEAELFLSGSGSDCGIANINIGTSGAEIGGAFGGEKETGGGRESGSDAWKAYMRRQTNTINWGKTLPLAQGIEFN